MFLQRMIRLALALALSLAGFGFAGAHATPRPDAAAIHAVAAEDCHGPAQKAEHTRNQAQFCSDLCCAMAPPAPFRTPARIVSQAVPAIVPIVFESLGRAPPAPPPRG
jgi:hypothetical protein